MLYDLSAAGRRAKVRSVVCTVAVTALFMLTVIPVAQVGAVEPCDIVEFTGVIEALPDGGLIGDWTISGVVVHVSADTEIIDQGPVVVGAEAMVRGCSDGEAVAALGIKVLGSEEPCDEVRLEGVIEALPEGLLGEWTVSGFVVVVTEGTEIQPADLEPTIGMAVVVEGCAGPEGIIEAQFVKLFPVEEPCDPIRLEGVIEGLPDGLLGEWMVSGRTVVVGEATAIRPDGVVPEVGDEVIVEGCLREGVVAAEFVKILSGEEPCHPEDYRGEIVSLPDGLIGEWQVSDVTVVVTEDTEIDTRYGEPEVGRHVYVAGCVPELTAQVVDQPAVIIARYVKVLPEEQPCVPEDYRGEIVSLPDGLIGEWQVNDVTVVVSEDTEIETRYGEPEVGRLVFVAGCVPELTAQVVDQPAVIIARYVKVLPEEEPCDVVEMRGLIEALPDGGLIGDWLVAGVVVHVNEATEIVSTSDRAPAVGDEVLLRGCADGEAVTALVIKVVAAEPECEEVEFEGEIEALPPDGIQGDWLISGVVVHVTRWTKVRDLGPIEVGARAEVYGCADGESVDARMVKILPSSEPCEEVEFEGAVESLPDEGLLGDWVVAGTVVHVTEATKVAGRDMLAVGATVEVRGCADGEAVNALFIKVQDEDEDDAELRGPVESLPADGLIGDWVVRGVVVHVAPETVIDESHGEVAVGAVVEVEGQLLEDGSILAAKIKVEDDGDGDGGLGHPEATSFAVLHLLPTAAAPEAGGVALTRVFVREDGFVHEDLKVAAEHLLPDTIYDVMIDGFNAGAIHTNDDGDGCLFLSSRDIPGAEPLPSELRPVSGLSTVEVLDPGSIVVLTGDFADARRHDRTHPGTDFVAVALLRDGEGAVIGMAVASAEGDEQGLTLKVWGLEPGGEYVLFLDASEVTSLVADAEGMIEAEFADSPDPDELLLPAEFLPVSALLNAELRDSGDVVVASGDFGVVAEAAVSTSAGTARRRGGHH